MADSIYCHVEHQRIPIADFDLVADVGWAHVRGLPQGIPQHTPIGDPIQSADPWHGAAGLRVKRFTKLSPTARSVAK
jgi:hypothetical protein